MAVLNGSQKRRCILNVPLYNEWSKVTYSQVHGSLKENFSASYKKDFYFQVHIHFAASFAFLFPSLYIYIYIFRYISTDR